MLKADPCPYLPYRHLMSYRYIKPKSFHIGRHPNVNCGSTWQLKAYGPNFSNLDLKVLKRRTNKR